MSKTESRSAAAEKYYECTSCGYSAPVDTGIGLCPSCRDTLSEKVAFE